MKKLNINFRLKKGRFVNKIMNEVKNKRRIKIALTADLLIEMIYDDKGLIRIA